MKNAAQILSYFEQQLQAILASREETEKQMRETEAAVFEQYSDKTPAQIQLHEQFKQRHLVLQTGINLEIASIKLADVVHKKITELISKKQYPIEEILWVRFIGTQTWHFKFNY